MSIKKYGLLWALFTLICLGLGYPALNRVDVSRVTGLRDVTVYRAMVRGGTLRQKPLGWKHMNYRVLVPYAARPIYSLARGRVGSWDAAMLGLLIVTSLLTAATALLLLGIGLQVTRDYATSLLAALLFLLNFAVPNLRLSGFVDAGEGFFLLALLWALMMRRLALLPLILCGGVLAKESFLVFATVFGLAWWIFAAKSEGARAEIAWLAGAVAAALIALSLVHWAVDGNLDWPWRFGTPMSSKSLFLTRYTEFRYLKHLVWVSLLDINSLYIFGWLLPLASLRLRQIPVRWRFATVCAILSALFLNGYYGGGPGTLGRALFSIAGPMLTLAAALWLMGLHPAPIRAASVKKAR